MVRPNSSQFNPQTSFYNYNYGVGMNYYQPMIDYIEEKDRGKKVVIPRLPWTDERGLSQYDPRKPVQSYSAEDLTKISLRTEARARAHLKNFKATSVSSFQLSTSASAANLTQKLKTEKKKKEKLIKEIDKAKYRIMGDDIDYNPNEDKDIAYQLKAAQKYMRGKSAKSIERQLLSQSRKNIAESAEFDVKQSKQLVTARAITLHHTQVMTDRLQKQLEDSFVQPLDALSEELRGFDKRTSRYCYETR